MYYVDSQPRLLIAENTDILEAFIDNGLHMDHQIYCQFPLPDSLSERVKQSAPLSVEFNDGNIISDQQK
ncbi:hypothetical protein ABT56_19780 [Photobacterium aquae]|uniref:Uncharacterized protein n=1 Tax=Photobacterium aquae TaxID=1195763 RepID=A0A0J1GUM3_9GAMM|nr:hypothetical protein [Photobacterium aquae]KLV03366.1 hypothetical protein ABT56_19780 [Photobacterium aquae]